MDPTEFRRALAQFATGVTVVTVPDPQEEGAVHGMTANAFTSVSLNPPLVLVCVDRRARTHDKIAQARAFGMSILRSDQVGVSRHFAGQIQPEVEAAVRYRWVRGIPVLEECLAYLTCRLWASYDGGDHTIYVGEVQDLAVRGGEALGFWQSRYCRIGEALESR